MSSLNQVFLIGNLTRDPEVRTIAGGTTVAEIRLAVSDNYKDKEGKQVERTCFTEVVVWGKQAEACQQFLKKGAPVMVEGKLQLDQWTTEQGDKRSKLRIRAGRIQFLGRPTAKTERASSPEHEEEAIEPIPF